MCLYLLILTLSHTLEKTFSSLIFWKHGAVNELYGATDISFQTGVAGFPVILGLQKPKMLHTGTCASTSTRHVTLKSPLLFQFPCCELYDNDHKQSNYRLINVLFCTRTQYLVLTNLQSIQSNKERNATIFLSISRLYASLGVKFQFLPKKPRQFFTFFSFLDQSS